MRIAYFDCFSGISGDMTLGALIDAGVSPDALRRELARLPLGGYHLESKPVQRAGIRGTKVDVVLAPAPHDHRHHVPHHSHRGLTDIQKLLETSTLDPSVRSRALRVFENLARAEAHVHGSTIEEVHFHEVGAVDAIVDVVGSVIGLDLLGIQEVHSSPLPVGSGFVESAHGRLPVPAPAVTELLKGFPLSPSSLTGELTTPTGAALVTTLAVDFGPLPAMTVEHVGYGAGSRDPEQAPNLLRLVIGDDSRHLSSDFVWKIETNIDDMSGELLAHLQQGLFAAGALDVYASPVMMKKGRVGTELTVLVSPENKDRIERTLFTESTTFGLRSSLMQRRKLVPSLVKLPTELGELTVKIGTLDGEIVTAAPEYEVCRKIAEEKDLPLKQVYDRALEAWRIYAARRSEERNRP